ncbi:hypothetical protein MNBD_GAMMA24-1647 [hydrothermal vent metagenome]|uniref:ZipA C-terminal FtsZ-binding domain-containing protein n=1 Tax=hydrothermal vent metagenome TaxID=652676 RepID=A0A3B1BGP0_9ZZZZ
MDSLRLILLLLGLVFIAGMYFWYRLKQDDDSLKFPQLEKILKQFGGRFSRSRKEVDLATSGEHDDFPDDDIEHFSTLNASLDDRLGVDISEPMSIHVDTAVLPGDELILVLAIMAGPGKQFSGLDILDTLLANGFVHGDMSIFHYFHAADDRQPVFSLASAVEPGIFDMNTIEALRTPGLSLFMQLPGTLDARTAFETMLEKGRLIATDLRGELCDETRSVLTMQTIGHLKEEIEAWLFKLKMSHLRAR